MILSDYCNYDRLLCFSTDIFVQQCLLALSVMWFLSYITEILIADVCIVDMVSLNF